MTAPTPITTGAPRRSHTIATLAIAGLLTLTACGDDDTQTGPPSSADASASPSNSALTSEDATSGDAGPDDGEADRDGAGTAVDGDSPGVQDSFPVTIDTSFGEVTIESRPERIVSLSPAATEILFAIGAGDQVIAADEYSTYPANAPTTELSGWSPNIEAITAYEPDLVVVSYDPDDLIASLNTLGIPVIPSDAPTDIESGYAGMALLGSATGHADEAAELIATMRTEIDAALADAPSDVSLRIYHELDDTFYTVSSASLIGSIYASMGATNIADAADPDGSGYPQMTEEAIIAANPQVIIVPSDMPYGPQEVAARPGWAQVDAVRNDALILVDSDISSRWGPRLPEMVRLLSDALNEAAVGASD